MESDNKYLHMRKIGLQTKKFEDSLQYKYYFYKIAKLTHSFFHYSISC